MSFRTISRSIRFPVTAFAARSLVGTISLFRQSHLRLIAAVMARPIYALPPVRRLVLANLEIAFPDWGVPRRRRVARESVRSMCLVGLEFAWYLRHPDRVREGVTYGTEEARNFIRGVIEGKQSAIILTPHVGNWELSAQFVCCEGMELCAVARRIENPGIDRLVTERRTRNGLRIIKQAGAAKEIVRALRGGISVGMLMDQNIKIRKGGIYVDFFGLPVPTTRAPAALARRTGVEVACVGCIRCNDRFELHIKRLPQPVADYRDDHELTQAMLKLNEAFAAQYPEQYLWHYERWRNIPHDAGRDLQKRYPYYRRLTSPTF